MIKRGQLWWAELPSPEGYEPGMRRPLCIVSSDDFNRSRLPTVQAVILTSNLKLAQAPGNLLLPSQETHLPSDTVANVAQVVTVEKETLQEHVSTLSHRRMEELGSGLRLALDL